MTRGGKALAFTDIPESHNYAYPVYRSREVNRPGHGRDNERPSEPPNTATLGGGGRRRICPLVAP
ncbi:hypothetical protein GA0070622_3481 [Micromonospora sediminicola]|uniref:Uncharacterized protein n=1 Tax=Micromonospora sediminicola TaxID=946078 RepID=A0A1A9BBU4_9ACTN|nr:hypothetical protein GA0070622_3481 [Micromonospora sediminicola]